MYDIEPYVLYRIHQRNHMGVRRNHLARLYGAARYRLNGYVQDHIMQAREFARLFGDEVSSDDRRILRQFCDDGAGWRSLLPYAKRVGTFTARAVWMTLYCAPSWWGGKQEARRLRTDRGHGAKAPGRGGATAVPLKLLFFFGTRPEAIKVAPVLQALRTNHQLRPVVVVSGQHRQMLDQVLTLFEISPDFDLDIIQERQSLAGITTRALQRLSPIIEAEEPAMVLVQGDTTTTFVGALAAFYHQVPVAHIEAGLRTGSRYSPYPEK